MTDIRTVMTPARCRIMCLGWLALLLGWTVGVAAQASRGTLEGTVVDRTGGVLPGANITVKNVGTSMERPARSGSDGAFVVTALPPGQYVVLVELTGFAPSELRGIQINVDDRIAVQVEMRLASQGESVTVVADTQRISTSPSVSTVIDRNFIESIPLNGRSLQSLLELTPGVLLTRSSPQATGQFTVNGQRTSSNYFSVDGVSANVGVPSSIGGLTGQGGSGSLPSMTALGTTNSIVSIDALQEFRIQTSSFAPEFGRTPGGQVSLVTRSGTNRYVGSAFEFVRHDAMEANDWFLNRSGLPKTKLRQHSFGGVFGGPIIRDRAFFFASYEGVRLLQPRVVNATVPSLELRQTAHETMRPFLNAYPRPTGPDRADGTAEVMGAYSDPSNMDSVSGRLDYQLRKGLSFFGRYNYAPSFQELRGSTGAYASRSSQNNRSLTLGSTWLLSSRTIHDLRVNYSSNGAPYELVPKDFGGAVIPSESDVFQSGTGPDTMGLLINVNGVSWGWGTSSYSLQRQFNVIDSVTIAGPSHEWKFGLDYRRTSPVMGGISDGYSALTLSAAGLRAGRIDNFQLRASDPERRSVAFDNFSLFAQDNWKATSRLLVTYGIRWDLVPPPHTIRGNETYTAANFDPTALTQLRLAPRGTALWKTRYNNFAPRVGASYVLSDKPGAQLVLKGGWGVFYDLGYGAIGNAYGGTYPFVATRRITNTPLPLTAADIALPDLATTPASELYMNDPNLELPQIYQWNVSAERSFGSRQTIAVGYVGARGRDLLKQDILVARLAEFAPSNTVLAVTRNIGYSDYQSLQLQFQRRLASGFQMMTSYTYGVSKDTNSTDGVSSPIPTERLSPSIDYGYSDYDIRHAVTTGLTYQLSPSVTGGRWGALIRNWGIDIMARARSGAPINVTTNVQLPPDTFTGRPDVISGQPFWIDDATVPTGRRLNRAAFAFPEPGRQGTLPRGSVRGFNLKQIDLSLRRDLEFIRSSRIQLKVDLFNVTNTPNFLDPTGNLSNAQFGVAANMYSAASTGLASIYRIGGPRSVQLGAKISF